MADHRPNDPGVARIILQAQQLNEERNEQRRLAFRRIRNRECMATMMLGTASLSLGVVLMTVTLVGLSGKSFGSLSLPQQVLVEATPRQLVSRFDSETNQMVSEPARVVWGSICLPSMECAWLGVVGLALGLMGLGSASRRREFSWSSAIGTSLILLTLVIVNIAVLVLDLVP